MKAYALLLAPAALLLFACGDDGGDSSKGSDDALPGVAAAWAVHGGARVEKDDLDHPAEAGNAAWRDGTVRLFGARNELIAFQLVVEAGAGGIEALDVELSSLEQRDGSGKINYTAPADDPTEYAGRPIQIFTLAYMQIDEPSDASWVFDRDGPAAPSDPTGVKPVQLVPEHAAAGRGGLPVDVPAGENQAFWFDIYLSSDLPAGPYEGAVELRVGDVTRRVPIELEVFDFSLPDRGSMTAMVYFEPEQTELYQGRRLDERYHRFAHRHRIELVHAYTSSSLAAAAGRFDGSDFSPAAGYDGPGAGAGNRVAPASFYGPPEAYEEEQSAWEASDAFMNAISDHVTDPITFLYMPDEPGPSQYDAIREVADNVHSNPGPGSELSIFVTSAYASGLDGAIDIWCSFPGSFSPERAAKERAAGRSYWFYNGQRPATGALTIDAPATDARVQPWIAFKHDVETYFYWHANHWRHNSQKVGERNQNVWKDPVTFDNRDPNSAGDEGFIHGDGVLIYPGEEVLHPEQDRGVAGPIASMRLANLRRGLQDHLYLTLARERGLDAEVDAALESVVPAVFTDASGDVEFAEDGGTFEAARRDLARAIAGAR